MAMPDGLNLTEQIGLAQTVTDSRENGVSAACTLSKINARELLSLGIVCLLALLFPPPLPLLALLCGP